jgi:sugar lactone lactonase YvrE
MSNPKYRALPSVRWLSAAGGVLLVLGMAGCQKSRQEPQVAAAPPPSPPEQQQAQAPAQTAPAQEQAAPAPAPAAPAPVVLKDLGFRTPEAVFYDAEQDVYLVSNINGGPAEADGNGFISKVGPDGKLIELKWIDGTKADVTLNAPKGMAVSGDKLYVADLTFVRVFDRKTGKALGKIGAAGATFLNAVAAAPDGTIYVSDSGLKAGKEGLEPTGSDAIYRIGTRGTAEPVLRDKSLNRPNGLVADNEGVWVASFGSNELYRVNVKGNEGKKEQVHQLPTGALDGLVALPDGSVLVSSWAGGAVYRGKPGGSFSAVVKDVKSPAAIGYDQKRNALLIPLFESDAVQIHTIGAAPAPQQGASAAAPAPQPAAGQQAPAPTPAQPGPAPQPAPAQPAPAKAQAPAGQPGAAPAGQPQTAPQSGTKAPAAPPPAAAPASGAKPAAPPAPAPAPGAQAPAQGAQPPAQGAQPPAQGAQPPAQGAQPPTQAPASGAPSTAKK